ncbi:MAG: hypothetical protein AAF404_17225 [Pseudomonadota bacterium]
MVPLSRGRMEQARLEEKELLLYSYENLMLPRLAEQPLIVDSDLMLGTSEHCSQVIIIREFYNWIVSRLKLYELVGQQIDVNRAVRMLVDLWLVYAREYCGRTEFLNRNRVGILFDQWVMDEDYRRDILDQLGITVRDNSNGKVPRGGGSSFNEDQGRTQVSSAGVLNRWQHSDVSLEVRRLIEDTVESRADFDSLYDEVLNRQPLASVVGA